MDFYKNIAANFNALMGIGDGFFGHARRASEPGAGAQRAAKRLDAERKATAERLADAPILANVSRQQRRALARKYDGKITDAERGRRNMKALKAAKREAQA